MAVEKFHWALEYVPEKLKTREICLAAMGGDINRFLMRFVPEHIRKDGFLSECLGEINNEE